MHCTQDMIPMSSLIIKETYESKISGETHSAYVLGHPMSLRGFLRGIKNEYRESAKDYVEWFFLVNMRHRSNKAQVVHIKRPSIMQNLASIIGSTHAPLHH